jgi:hypothetical protein
VRYFGFYMPGVEQQWLTGVQALQHLLAAAVKGGSTVTITVPTTLPSKAQWKALLNQKASGGMVCTF